MKPFRFTKIRVRFSVFALILSLLLFSVGCGNSSGPVSRAEFYFDTIIRLTLYDRASTEKAEEIFDGYFALAEYYEKLFSRTYEGSDVWNINHAQGLSATVDPETVSLLKTALYYAELTDGAVDPTIAPLSDLWNFSENNAENNSHRIPPAQDIAAALSHVDYHAIELDENACTVTLTDPDAAIDLGFIAKGYIADQMKQYLIAQGVKSAVIDLGGNILTLGSRPDGSAFRVGVHGETKPLAVLPVTDCSLVSSGNYERYFELDGVIYHHILDAKTGYPVQNTLYQVTILSDSSLEGDALSTTCYVLGLDAGMELINSIPDVEAIFVTKDDYELHYSEGMDEYNQ